MALSFAFDPSQGETSQSLEAKRAVAMALARAGTTGVAHNAGEGLAKVGNALAYAMAMSNYTDAEGKAQKDYADSLNAILGGGAAPVAPAAPAVPSQPQIPSQAVSSNSLTDTPAPLSGGTLPQNSPPLADAVARLESSNSPVDGPAGGYANFRFQQFPAFVKQYGTGAGGVLNYAKQVLAANPNATFGDMYGGYVTGTGNPATARVENLQTTTQPGAQGAYGNLVRNSPIDPRTPLSQLIGGVQVASSDPNFVPSSGGMSPQLSALLSPNMTVGQGAFSPQPALAFNGQPQSANPLAPAPQASGFAPQGGQPNITTVQTRPATLPVEGQNSGRAAVVQALQAQPQQTPTPAANIPPQVAETIRRLSMNPLPQAQTMAAQLMQRYMAPPQYDLIQGADGTITAVNKLNPRDNYVAARIAAKPIAVQPGGTLVVPGATGSPSAGGAPSGSGGAFNPVYQNTTGLFDKQTLTAMADQYLTGDKSVLQNLGRTAIGGMNMSALRERIVTRSKELGIDPTEIASRIGQFDSYTSAQKATGTRGGNVTMAATEAANLGTLVNETSAGVPRSNYPVWNRVTNAYAENTGDPNIVKFTGALNSYVNAYARAINPSGTTTVSDKEHAREILDTAMSHGQIEAGISQLQKELEQAKAAPASSSETIKKEFMQRANPRNSEALTQARDAISKGANKAAVIQRLQSMGIDPSGL